MQSRRPEHLSPLASQVLDVLQRYTMFPWPLLKTQAERHGLDGTMLDQVGLALIVDDLEKALARFGSVEKAETAAAELRQLAQGA